MKTRKIFGILLGIVVMLLGMSMTAWADDVTEYNLWVGGTRVTSKNYNGKNWYYNANTNTLRLNGRIYGSGEYTDSNNNTYDYGIRCSNSTLIINVNTESTVIGSGTNNNSCGILAEGCNLTIKGNGRLIVMGGSGSTGNGVSGYSIGIKAGTIKILGEVDAYGGLAGTAGKSIGIEANQTIVENSGELTAIGYNIGIKVGTSGEVSINGGHVTAIGGTYGISGIVKNTNTGTGWIDKEGTGNGTSITVNSDGQSLSDYKKVVFQAAAGSNNIDVTSVTLSKTSLSTVVDPDTDVLALFATIEPGTATFRNLEWSNSDEKVVKANPNGPYRNPCYLYPLSAGTATITVTATNGTADKGDDKTAECIVKVYDSYKTGKVWYIGETINLHGAWFLPQENATYLQHSKDENGVVSNPHVVSGGAVAEFLNFVPVSEEMDPETGYEPPYEAGRIVSLILGIPSNKRSETPIGIRLAKGKGTLDSPYEFEPVFKTDSNVTAPKARTLTYNGQTQALITAGSVTGGTMQYAIGKDDKTAPTSGWSVSIPTATDAGTYYVWYKTVGDKYHSDSKPVCIPVTIGAAPKAPTVDNADILLNSALLIYWKGSDVELAWGTVPTADSYEVWATYCGTETFKNIQTIQSGNKAVISALDGKPLDKKHSVKAYVIAKSGGVEIGRSLIGHAAGPKNRHTNVKKLKVKKHTYNLKVGKTAKIKVTTKKMKGGKSLLPKRHDPRLRYLSTNTNVATVSGKGKITAVGAGTCDVWVYAQNGRSQKMTVTVQ